MVRHAGSTADVAVPRQWARTPRTRAQILAAAEDVFQERGYGEATIADIVERAGVSVGSVYHHFGGKAEVYLALWEERQTGAFQASQDAVAAARRDGKLDLVDQFLEGTRAYLATTWKRRRLTSLFVADDGPPGFEALRRQNSWKWISQNSTLLGVSDDLAGRVLVASVTSIIGDGSREIAGTDDPAEAEAGIEVVVEYVARLLRD